jgi:arylsulfatase A-like enzyme
MDERRQSMVFQRMASQAGLLLGTAIPAGLFWGGLTAFLGGLSILISGHDLVGLWPRFWVLLYLMTTSALLMAGLLVLVGLAGVVVLVLLGQVLSRGQWWALCSGLALALTFILNTIFRFRILGVDYGAFRWPALGVVAVLGFILGAALAWAVWVGARRWQSSRGFLRPLSWRALRGMILCAFTGGLLLLILRGGYRVLFDGRTTSVRESPNVVLITVDALRADALGIYGGSAESPSPHLDTLAQQGILFQDVTAPASWALPSIAALHTSLYPSELSVSCRPFLSCDPRLDERRVTLAESLAQAGYHTQAYLTNPWFSPAHGFAQGFDGYEVIRPDLAMDLERLRQDQFWIALAWHRVPFAYHLFEEGYRSLIAPRLSLEDRGAAFNGMIDDYLQRHREDSFFLWIHYATTDLPHNPVATFPVQGYPKEIAQWDMGKVVDNRHLLTYEALLADLHSLYLGEVAEVDALIGNVLAQIDSLGLSDRTLVVVTAGHGEEFGEHGDLAYGHTLYQEIVRVPLIVRGPAWIEGGRSVETPISLVDLMPTILESVGAPLPAEAGGRSLMPALRGERLEIEPVYSESLYRCYCEWKALRLGSSKLVYDLDRDRLELYDLYGDPTEQYDLARERVEEAQEMLHQLQHWMERTGQTAASLPRAERRGVLHPAIAEMLIEMGGY